MLLGLNRREGGHVGVKDGRRWVAVGRVAVSVAAVVAFASAGHLAAPPPVHAIDCNLVLHPLAVNDPSTPGDPNWSALEDNPVIVAAPGVLANDSCAAGVDQIGFNPGTVNGM
jgi:hypothetical protein